MKYNPKLQKSYFTSKETLLISAGRGKHITDNQHPREGLMKIDPNFRVLQRYKNKSIVTAPDR